MLRTLEFFSVSDVFQVKVAGTPSLGGVVVATRTPSVGFTMPHSRATLSDVRMLSPVTINVRMLARWSFCKAPKQKKCWFIGKASSGPESKRFSQQVLNPTLCTNCQKLLWKSLFEALGNEQKDNAIFINSKISIIETGNHHRKFYSY